jgi:diguanylate cyclase (GGDEF)-like protein
MESLRHLRQGYRSRYPASAGQRLAVIPTVLTAAGLHLLLIGKYLWWTGSPLRTQIMHPVDVGFKVSFGLAIGVAMALVWAHSPNDRATVRMLDWFGGGLLSLVFTLFFSTPDEFFLPVSPGPLGSFLVSNAWVLWAAAGAALLITATGKTAHELRSERKERERLEALMEFTRLITSLDYQSILDEAVKHLHRLLNADAVVLFLWNEEDQALVPMAGVHDREIYPAGYVSRMMSFKCPAGFGLTGWVMQTGEPYISGDVMADSKSQGVPGYPVDEKSCMLAPIQVEGHRLGVVRLSRRGVNQFTADDLDLALSFARQAALVIEHGRTVKELSDLSITDSLTGLYNSRHFHHILAVEVSRAQRHNQPLSLVMVDSDSLKRLNDLYGHQRGDDYLREIGQVIQDQIRLSDYAFRYAGDEFLLLLPNTEPEEAAVVAERIRRVMQSREVEVGLLGTVSVGVAAQPIHARDGEALLAAADRAMYASKRAGKNRVTVADSYH